MLTSPEAKRCHAISWDFPQFTAWDISWQTNFRAIKCLYNLYAPHPCQKNNPVKLNTLFPIQNSGPKKKIDVFVFQLDKIRTLDLEMLNLFTSISRTFVPLPLLWEKGCFCLRFMANSHHIFMHLTGRSKKKFFWMVGDECLIAASAVALSSWCWQTHLTPQAMIW